MTGGLTAVLISFRCADLLRILFCSPSCFCNISAYAILYLRFEKKNWGERTKGERETEGERERETEAE